MLRLNPALCCRNHCGQYLSDSRWQHHWRDQKLHCLPLHRRYEGGGRRGEFSTSRVRSSSCCSFATSDIRRWTSLGRCSSRRTANYTHGIFQDQFNRRGQRVSLCHELPETTREMWVQRVDLDANAVIVVQSVAFTLFTRTGATSVTCVCRYCTCVVQRVSVICERSTATSVIPTKTHVREWIYWRTTANGVGV